MTGDKRLELSVGFFVVLGLAAVGYITLQLGAGALVGTDTYPLEARFANTGGLNKGSSVMLGGVTVGRVDAVRLDQSDFSAIVEMSIVKDLLLPSDTMASIRTSGLIGDKFVALAPGAEDELLRPSDRILMTESAVELESLISKMAFGSVEADESTATGTAAPETYVTP